MDYKEATDYLFSQLPMFSRVGAPAYKPGLDTSLRLDEFFGHPHRRFRSIHVAGTNGKGSTSHLIAAILQSQGYRVGLYTSPHLADYRERMRVDGQMIPREEVVNFTERFRDSGYDGHPSFFELTMMMAFDFFACSEVDYAVIEVGMGGRLDSTNIITPILGVITNISFDHTQFLGTTLAAIAGEKAGIIKPGIPVVIGEAEGEVREVFARKATEENAPIVFAQDTPLIEAGTERNDANGWHFRARGFGEIDCPLGGYYQLPNFNTALHAVEELRRLGVEISDSAVREGFAGVTRLTGLRGRWMPLGKSPLRICDTGHNTAGLQWNMKQLDRWRNANPEGKLRIVAGFVADKDVDSVLQLFPKDAEYYITQADIPRAMPAVMLAGKFREAGLEGTVFPTVKEAYEAALADASERDFIYIGGSTFVVADLLRDCFGE